MNKIRRPGGSGIHTDNSIFGAKSDCPSVFGEGAELLLLGAPAAEDDPRAGQYWDGKINAEDARDFPPAITPKMAARGCSYMPRP
jgi:hypothetical protein